MDFTTLTGEALTAALPITDITSVSAEDLTAGLAARKTAAKALFALSEPTVAQVSDAKALLASIGEVEAEVARRDATAAAAGKEFAAMKATFSETNEPDDAVPGEERQNSDLVDPDEQVQRAADTRDTEGASHVEGLEGDNAPEQGAAAEGDGEGEGEGEGDGDGVTTASVDAASLQKVKASATKTVGRKTVRPAVAASSKVVITASADVPNVPMGTTLDMDSLTKAIMSRVNGFNPFNERAAEMVRNNSGGAPVIQKHPVAQMSAGMDKRVTASQGNDYAAVRNAIKDQIGEGALTAAGWCAPSEVLYSYIADYVVDGLVSVPEVSAPRGGLMTTTGPQRSSQGSAVSGFGFTQTEAQAIAGTPKKLETILCPTFTDHRLDAVGYGYTIPFLTQKAYPELIADTLKFASVLWAHRMNARRISDMVALSTTRTFEGYGPSLTDTLEAVSLLCVKERRKWSLGQSALMQVVIPEFVREVFRADISRRANMTVDSVKDEQIIQHFTDRHLVPNFVADWQELSNDEPNIILPGSFNVMVFPAGTFVSALEDVVNLSAFYDTASVTVNQYTGVFFEQGYMLFKAGYGSSLVNCPINTAGEMGALTLTGSGDKREGGGSF